MAQNKNVKGQKSAHQIASQRARTRNNKLRRIDKAMAATSSEEHKARLQACKNKWVMGVRG